VLTAEELATRLTAEAAAVESEIEEIDLLITQAKTEAARHETRRTAAADKLAIAAEQLATAAGGSASSKNVADLANQLVNVARKAALMEAQIDLLEGKRKSIGRLLELIKAHAAEVREMAGLEVAGAAGGAGSSASDASPTNGGPRAGGSAGSLDGLGSVADDEAMPPAVRRLVLSGQEDLRREIARQLHDGPAQSLTNIVLQAQIVDRLLARDPEAAGTEVEGLIAMVQRTLDATKTFIFDIRPMVLDDLGLVPTLRRASRDRGARAKVKVEFESIGMDRRLPMELESGLFRIVDEALAAHIAGKPETLTLKLDWTDDLEIELTAGRTPPSITAAPLPPAGADLPPALATMVEERRIAQRAAVEEARLAALARLPERLWREVHGRAETLGIQAELLDEGARLHLLVKLPEQAAGLDRATETAAT
jgi:two-component system sensor histidine kinase DegS